MRAKGKLPAQAVGKPIWDASILQPGTDGYSGDIAVWLIDSLMSRPEKKKQVSFYCFIFVVLKQGICCLLQRSNSFPLWGLGGRQTGQSVNSLFLHLWNRGVSSCTRDPQSPGGYGSLAWKCALNTCPFCHLLWWQHRLLHEVLLNSMATPWHSH